MMINILIDDTNTFYRYAMQLFLEHLFGTRFGLKVRFVFELTGENVEVADVIVISLCRGERYTCIPELLCRKKGIVIGIVDMDELNGVSPSCFSDIVYVARNFSVHEMTVKISTAWYRWMTAQTFTPCRSCLRCNHYQLTKNQKMIMLYFLGSQGIKYISAQMNISSKTIFAQKYLVMQKFKLRNNIELMALLKKKCRAGPYLDLL